MSSASSVASVQVCGFLSFHVVGRNPTSALGPGLAVVLSF